MWSGQAEQSRERWRVRYLRDHRGDVLLVDDSQQPEATKYRYDAAGQLTMQVRASASNCYFDHDEGGNLSVNP